MTPFQAFRVHLDGDRPTGRLETIGLADLSPGEVVIRGAWSSINYKDALAATGAGKILRKYPLVAGIDISGTVAESTDPRFAAGDEVVVVGCGLSETVDGGFTQFARVRGDSVTKLPAGLDLRSAMAIGTAGFTAGLALHRMEQNGQRPDQGPVAIDIFSRRGYSVTALTHKTNAADYLKGLGAHDVQSLGTAPLGTRPLEKVLWAGAVDNLGGEVLAWFTRTTQPFGNIASIGLAGGTDLHTTVMPFIIRGVSLLGINSVETPRDLRIEVWKRLGGDLHPAHLDRIVTRVVTLDQLPGCFEAYVAGRITGRTIVQLNP
jgi:NADPH2:quinone reductase